MNELTDGEVFGRQGELTDEEVFGPKAKATAVLGAASSADEAGKVIDLSSKMRVSPTMIEGDVAYAQQKFREKEASEAAAVPEISRYVNKDPINAKVSNDDWPTLKKIKETLDATDRAVMDAAYNGWKALTNYDPTKESGLLRGAEKSFKEGGQLGLSPQNQIDFPNFYLAWNWLLAPLDATFRFPFAVGAGLGEMIREQTGSEAAAREAENFLRWQFSGQARIGPTAEAAPRISKNVEQFLKNAESVWNTEKGRAARAEIDEFIRTREAAANEPQLKLLPAPTKVTVRPEESPYPPEQPAINPVADRMARNGEIPHTGLDQTVDQMKLDLAKADAASFDQVFTQVQESKTLQRSPVAMESYLGEVFGPKKIWISPQVLLDLYKSGVPAKGDGLFGYVPDLEKQLEIARDTGVDIQIPVSTYMAWTDPAVHSQIKDQIRFREGQPTKEEWKDYIEVYHGSPARFEAFSMKFMGSGEGAQAFAYGHYLAENLEVAKEYQNKLGLRSLNIADATLIDNLKKKGASDQEIIERLKKNGNMYAEQELAAYNRGDRGNLYRAQIKGKPEDFLDWDAPLQEQPQFREKLLKAAEKLQLDSGELAAIRGEKTDQITGEELYGKLKRLFGNEAASKALAEAGIPGVRFLDQGSRAQPSLNELNERLQYEKENIMKFGEPTNEASKGVLEGLKETVKGLEKQIAEFKETRNYVVFSDADIRITHINDISLSPEAKKLLETPAAQIALEAGQAEKDSLYLHPLIQDAKTLNLTEPEFKRYSKLIEKSDQASVDKAVALAKRDIAKRQTAEWKKNEVEIRAEVQSDLRSRPDIAADRYFREGVLPTGERVPKVKLDKEAVEEIVGKGSLEGLTRADGIHPDDAAEVVGFSTGEDMVKALDLLDMTRKSLGETPKKYFDRVVEQETAQRMEDRYGELEQNILAEARANATSPIYTDILIEEMKHLAKAAGGMPPLTKDGIELQTKIWFDETPIDQASRYERYRRAVEKGGREAEKNLLKKDYLEAFHSKQRQTLAFQFARHSEKLKKDLTAAYKSWSKLEARAVKGIDGEFLNRIHQVLDMIGWGSKRNPIELAEAIQGETLEAFAKRGAFFGRELPLPEFLIDGSFTPVNRGGNRKLEDLTVDEFRAVKDFITALETAGRDANLIDMAGKKEALDEVKGQIVANLLQRKMIDPDRAHYVSKFSSLLLKPEIMANDFDLGDPLGPFTQAVFRPAKEAQIKETKLIEKIAGELRTVRGDRKWRNSLDNKVPNNVIRDPVKGDMFPLTRGQLINIALTFGNRSNIEKFSRAYSGVAKEKYGAHVALRFEMQVKDLINKNLKEQDWKYIEKIWSIYNDLWKDEISPMYRELTGVGPTPIAAEKFQTPFGEKTGGYFPVFYDHTWSNIDLIREQAGPLYNNYTRATPGNGYIQERTGYIDYMDFRRTPERLVSDIQQKIHDVSFRRAVLDIGKIIYDEKIRKAIDFHYGPDYANKLHPWLEYIANRFNVDDPAMNFGNKILQTARRNLVVQALGFNPKVIFSPDMGPFFTPGNLATFSWMISSPRNYIEQWRFAHEKSQELPLTMANIDRDFHDQFNSLTRKMQWSDFRAKIAYASMWPAARTSQVFRTVTFLRNYHEGLAKGLSENDAIFVADAAVRKWHGAHSKVDLAPMFRGGELWKTITIFQGYFNTQWNLVRGIGQKGSDWRDAAAVSVNSILVGAAFGYFLFNKFTQDETWGDRMAKSLILQLGGMVPFLNYGVSYAYEGNTAKLPIMSVISGIVDPMIDVAQMALGKRGEPPKWVKHFINLPGYIAGAPMGAIATAMQFIHEVEKGKQRPASLGEWWRGLTTGQAKEKRR